MMRKSSVLETVASLSFKVKYCRLKVGTYMYKVEGCMFPAEGPRLQVNVLNMFKPFWSPK